MELFYMLVFLASLCGLMISVEKLLSIPCPQVPFVTSISLMSILYISSLLGLLLPISYLVFVAGLIYFCLNLYNCIKDNVLRNIMSPTIVFTKPLTSPLAIFGFLYCLNWFVFKDAYITLWDEFSAWGIFTKIAVEYDSIIAGFNNIPAAGYPRISALWQYYFILFVNEGEFRDGIAIFAQAVFFSSAAPIFLFSKNTGKYQILYHILSISCFFCLIYLFVEPVSSLYADSVLALCFGISIILYIANKQNKVQFLIINILLFSMVQIKPTGLIFASLAITVIAVYELCFMERRLSSKLIRLCVLAATILGSYISWSIIKFHSGITSPSIASRYSKFLSGLEDHQKVVVENFLYSLTYIGNNEIFVGYFAHPFGNLFTHPFGDFSLSPLYWTIIFLSFVFASSFYLQSWRDRTKHICLGVLLTIVVVIYTSLLLFTYMAIFSQYEAVRLASFRRYMGAVYLGVYLVLFFMLLQTEKKLLCVIFAGLIFCFTPTSILENISPNLSNSKRLDPLFRRLYNEIDPVISEMDKIPEPRVLYINQGGNGSLYVKFKFRAFPLYIDSPGLSVFSVATEERDEWAPWVRVFSAQELEDILERYDYLVICNDTDFFEQYGDVIDRSSLDLFNLDNEACRVRF